MGSTFLAEGCISRPQVVSWQNLLHSLFIHVCTAPVGRCFIQKTVFHPSLTGAGFCTSAGLNVSVLGAVAWVWPRIPRGRSDAQILRLPARTPETDVLFVRKPMFVFPFSFCCLLSATGKPYQKRGSGVREARKPFGCVVCSGTVVSHSPQEPAVQIKQSMNPTSLQGNVDPE